MARVTHGLAGRAAAGATPLFDLFEVLGQRWALRVLWELGADTLTYRALASRIPGMSTSVLTQRLRELREAGLVEHERGAGYRLSALGRDLRAHLEPLQEWAGQVGFAVKASDH